MLSFLSASTFYPFCLHPHFILLVRILSLLSASACYPFCPHPHFIIFICLSIRICVLSQPYWILYYMKYFESYKLF
jgi:hypothetical protein